MSLVELLVILLISLGVFDKSKILQYYQKNNKFSKRPKSANHRGYFN